MKKVVLLSIGTATITFGCLIALSLAICGPSAAVYVENTNRYNKYINDGKESDA